MSLTRRPFRVAALALSALLTALLTAPLLTAQAPAAAPRPRLVVMLTVDQLRPDYLTVWRGQFTGGYQRLLDEGAFFVNGYQDHANTETAPGHAAILSGRYPVRTGISANSLGVDIDSIPLVDFPGQGAGPARFRGSTLADWLQAADPRTRVLSVARKDRSAILPVASSPKHSVFWYAPQAGRFTTSVHYGDTLPSWVRRFNDERGVFALAGRTWDRLLPDSAYAGDQSAPGLPTFPHVLPSDSMRLASMQSTFPWMDSLTLALALRGVEAMQLGAADDRTDLLAVSLSNTDGIGHRYGPDAPELHDHVLRVDRWLGVFLDSLITLRGRDGIILALTADHGATPTPDLRSRWGDNTGALRIPSADLRRAFTAARAQLRTLGIDTLALSWSDLHLFLDRRRVAGREAELRPVVEAFLSAQRAVPGVLRADRFEDFLAADTTQDAYARRYLRMFVPGQEAPNGLVPLAVVTPRDLTVVGSGDVGRHGSPADADARVPIAFWGPGFAPGLRTTKAAVVDIAPTLADRLGVKPLESLDGRVLREVRR